MLVCIFYDGTSFFQSPQSFAVTGFFYLFVLILVIGNGSLRSFRPTSADFGLVSSGLSVL